MGAWTARELVILREHAASGADAVAAMLARSPGSVRVQAHRHGISLRRDGEHSGRRQAAASDPRATVVLAGPSRRSWCVLCGVRPGVRRPGVPRVCGPCRRAAVERYERDAAERAATRRDLDSARQVKHRARARD